MEARRRLCGTRPVRGERVKTAMHRLDHGDRETPHPDVAWMACPCGVWGACSACETVWRPLCHEGRYARPAPRSLVVIVLSSSLCSINKLLHSPMRKGHLFDIFALMAPCTIEDRRAPFRLMVKLGSE